MRQDFEHFQAGQRMFTTDALPRYRPIARLLLIRERVMLALLLGRFGILAQLVQSLIAAVSQTDMRARQRGSARFEQRKVRLLAFAKGRCDNLPRGVLGDYLGLLGMAFLLATVVATLFFFGRSQGHSVASTKTTSKIRSLWRRDFLPGR